MTELSLLVTGSVGQVTVETTTNEEPLAALLRADPEDEQEPEEELWP